jgi:sialate O-acetylesterase
MKRVFWAAALAAVVCLSAQARADVKAPALFTDGMVLQQGVKCPVWGTADPGEQITVAISTDSANAIAAPPIQADKDGKWIVQIMPPQPGGPYTLTLHGKNTVTIKDVYVGEVWAASGQSNMEMRLQDCAGGKDEVAKSKNPKIRLFTVPHKIAAEPTTDLDSKWVECGPDTAGTFSGVAYYFARDLQKARNVPIGIIHTSWGGTPAEAWTPRANLEGNTDLKSLIPAEIKIDDKKPDPHQATVLFNGMVAPLLPYAIKGVIWYQGESNAGRAYQYRTLFPTMIEAWRQQWKNPDMPFLFVQLAPWHDAKDESDAHWAELREAQLLASQKVKNTAEAVITDMGDEKDIHPKRKEAVGGRLALAALAVAYGEKVVYMGPSYDSVKFDGAKAILSFKSLGAGLEAKDGPLTGFSMAGDDKKFHEAKAEIKGDTVVVACDGVDKPVAVRYGWTNTPKVNLFNKDGLPASPFRTDDFPLTTAPTPK